MTIGTQDMELIKREMAGIRDFYQSRMDAELTPLKEEVGRIVSELGRVQNAWRDGEKRSILANTPTGAGSACPMANIWAWTCWTWLAFGVC